MNEISKYEVEEYTLYLEKISSIIHVQNPKIGALIFISEWYFFCLVLYLITGTWLCGLKYFPQSDIIPFIITILLGGGLLYIRESYKKASKKLRFLMNEYAYKELFDKMVRNRITIFVYVSFSLFATIGTISSFFNIEGTASRYGFAGQIFVIHNLIWYLIIGIPVLAEFVSLLCSIAYFPYLVSRGIEDDLIKPIEPYRCGGLRPVGELCLKAAAIYFIGLSLYTLLFYDTPVMIYLVYIMWALGIVIFLAPQYKVHKVLDKYKKDTLKDIESKIYGIDNMQHLFYKKTDEDAVSLLTHIILFIEVEKMHRYPFDLKICRDFIFVAILPLTINVITKHLISLLEIFKISLP